MYTTNVNANPGTESASIAHVVRTATQAHTRIRTYVVSPFANAGSAARFAFGDTNGRAHTESESRMSAPKNVTPKQLANEIGVDAKVLRAYLRKNHTRPDTAKNTSWIIPANVAAKARKTFEKNVATDTE